MMHYRHIYAGKPNASIKYAFWVQNTVKNGSVRVSSLDSQVQDGSGTWPCNLSLHMIRTRFMGRNTQFTIWPPSGFEIA